MNNSLPIIDELRAAKSFTAMAEWLTRCPVAIFASHGVEIADVVSRRAGAFFGVYAHGYIAAACAVRAGKFGSGFDETGHDSRRLMDRARMLDGRAGDFVGLELGWWRGGGESTVLTRERAAPCAPDGAGDNARRAVALAASPIPPATGRKADWPSRTVSRPSRAAEGAQSIGGAPAASSGDAAREAKEQAEA